MQGHEREWLAVAVGDLGEAPAVPILQQSREPEIGEQERGPRELKSRRQHGANGFDGLRAPEIGGQV